MKSDDADKHLGKGEGITAPKGEEADCFLIQLMDAVGNEALLMPLDSVEHEGCKYYLLAPRPETEDEHSGGASADVVVMRAAAMDVDGDPVLKLVEDEAVLGALYPRFKARRAGGMGQKERT